MWGQNIPGKLRCAGFLLAEMPPVGAIVIGGGSLQLGKMNNDSQAQFAPYLWLKLENIHLKLILIGLILNRVSNYKL